MNKDEFKALDFIDKINYLNKRLRDGDTVTKIREDIGIGEKGLQKEIKANGYKYNNKLKQYISTTENTTKSTTIDLKSDVVDDNTIVVYKQQELILEYLESNFDVLKEFIEKYKSTTYATAENTTSSIVINLVDDKHLSPKPKSIRINEFVYQDWQQFCNKNKYYSKQNLLSMALKEYMERH